MIDFDPALVTAWALAYHDRQCQSDCRDRQACAGRWIAHTSSKGFADAVEILTARPRDAAGARLALHDATCASGWACQTLDERAEHARRTQGRAVAALRSVLAARRAEIAP